MKKIVNVVLTSENIQKCNRALETMPKENTVVVCNTLDTDYRKELNSSLIARNYQIVHTESDGTPSTGKQSVIDWFNKTDYDYLVMIDGDDFFITGGYKRLEKIISLNEPDVLALVGENILVPSGISNWKDFEFDNIDNMNMPGAKRSIEMKMCFEFFRKTSGFEGYWFHRVMSMSKKATQNFEYAHEIFGLEDLVAQIDLKLNLDLHYFYLLDTEMMIYDKTDDGGVIHTMLTSDTQDFYSKIFGMYTHDQINTCITRPVTSLVLDPEHSKRWIYKDVIKKLKHQ